jgi:hypothetical protein
MPNNTSVRSWVEERQKYLSIDTLYKQVIAHWPHVKVTFVRYDYIHYAHPEQLTDQLISVIVACKEQMNCEADDVITIVPKNFAGEYAVVFTHDHHAVQFKLLAEPDPYVRVDLYGR